MILHVPNEKYFTWLQKTLLYYKTTTENFTLLQKTLLQETLLDEKVFFFKTWDN